MTTTNDNRQPASENAVTWAITPSEFLSGDYTSRIVRGECQVRCYGQLIRSLSMRDNKGNYMIWPLHDSEVSGMAHDSGLLTVSWLPTATPPPAASAPAPEPVGEATWTKSGGMDNYTEKPTVGWYYSSVAEWMPQYSTENLMNYDGPFASREAALVALFTEIGEDIDLLRRERDQESTKFSALSEIYDEEIATATTQRAALQTVADALVAAVAENGRLVAAKTKLADKVSTAVDQLLVIARWLPTHENISLYGIIDRLRNAYSTAIEAAAPPQSVADVTVSDDQIRSILDHLGIGQLEALNTLNNGGKVNRQTFVNLRVIGLADSAFPNRYEDALTPLGKRVLEAAIPRDRDGGNA